MTPDLFDLDLRAMRRDRAAALGPELFLLDRAFEDCLERLQFIRRSFSAALLLGAPDPAWAEQLRRHCGHVDVFDPGARFATAAGGTRADEFALPVHPKAYDLIVAVGTLDTANRLPDVMLRLRLALRPDGLFLGAVSGRETLSTLRLAMREADAQMGGAAPHVHPRLDPPSLAGLLSSAGFSMPVVDIDRVEVSYGSLTALVKDLRRMGATNILRDRPRRPLSRAALEAACSAFETAGTGQRTMELFEILHFAAWAPAQAD